MWCIAETRFVVHVCLRNPFSPFFLGIKSIHSLLVPEAWASWERNAPPALQCGRIMPMPSLQMQKKASLMQRSRRFGHGVVACKICFDMPYTDCAPVWLLQTKLLASVGWKWCCQPFSCRCSDVRKMWPISERRFVVHVCFRNPFPPFLLELKASTPYSYQKLELPESRSTLHRLCLNHGCIMPIPSSQLQKKPVICREAEGLITELWSPRFVTIQWLCFQLCYETAANQRTLVEIELLATVVWKRGCQPFSCRCSLHVMHCQKEIYATCFSKESVPAIPFGNCNHPTPTRSYCIMPIPSLQLQEKTSPMQRSRGFGHRVVVFKIC